jgi:hypothetical protein
MGPRNFSGQEGAARHAVDRSEDMTEPAANIEAGAINPV